MLFNFSNQTFCLNASKDLVVSEVRANTSQQWNDNMETCFMSEFEAGNFGASIMNAQSMSIGSVFIVLFLSHHDGDSTISIRLVHRGNVFRCLPSLIDNGTITPQGRKALLVELSKLNSQVRFTIFRDSHLTEMRFNDFKLS